MTTPPATMTAIAIAGKGGPEVLQPVTLPVPQPGGGQLLVKVTAAGVNRPDIMQRLGLYPAPKGHSEIPGLEVAGTVAAVIAGLLAAVQEEVGAGLAAGRPVRGLVGGGEERLEVEGRQQPVVVSRGRRQVADVDPEVPDHGWKLAIPAKPGARAASISVRLRPAARRA